MLRRSAAIALVFFALACGETTSWSHLGSLYPPHENPTEEDNVPRGLDLSINSVAPDGTIVLDLRNYSLDPFVFAGTPERPRLIIEVQSGNNRSHHTISPWSRSKSHELPPGERLQLKTDLGNLSGRVRIGLRSKDAGFTVWSGWFSP